MKRAALVLALISVPLLASCENISRVRGVAEPIVQSAKDKAVDTAIEVSCRMRGNTLVRQVQRKGPEFMTAMKILCPETWGAIMRMGLEHDLRKIGIIPETKTLSGVKESKETSSSTAPKIVTP